MSLEAMKKDDLVKHARSLEQELKDINSELEELKAKVSSNVSSNELPLTAVAIIPDLKTYHINYLELKFNMTGQVEVVKNIKYEPHKALFKAEETLAKMEKLNKGK